VLGWPQESPRPRASKKEREGRQKDETGGDVSRAGRFLSKHGGACASPAGKTCGGDGGNGGEEEKGGGQSSGQPEEAGSRRVVARVNVEEKCWEKKVGT